MSHSLYYEGPAKRRSDAGNIRAGLQWKGGPCVDVVCACGKQWHRCDTLFMYVLRCPACDRCYHVDDSVILIEMNAEEKADLEAHRAEVYRPKSDRYVPWSWMQEEATNLGATIDGQPGCAACWNIASECTCPCIAEQLIAAQRELNDLRREIARLKK